MHLIRPQERYGATVPVLVVLLLSVTCKREDKQTPKELDVDNEQEVTIELASGEVTLTLVQAEKLAVELQDRKGVV